MCLVAHLWALFESRSFQVGPSLRRPVRIAAKQKRLFNLIKVGYMEITQSIKQLILYKSASLSGSDKLLQKAIRSELKSVQKGLDKLKLLRERKQRFAWANVDWNSKLNSKAVKKLEEYEEKERLLVSDKISLLIKHKNITEKKVRKALRNEGRLQGHAGVTVTLVFRAPVRSASSGSM